MENPNSYSYRSHDAIESEDEDNDFDDNEENPDPSFTQNGDLLNYEYSKRHPKKRKLECFVSSYEFAHRGEIWREDEMFALLEGWGERFMELGRMSLRAEDWVEITEKVSEMGGVERTEAECRNQMDVLKKKYKKEMAKVECGRGSKWVFLKKMDALLNMRTRGHCGLGCGVDSGEYVFMDPRVYLDKSNVLDEMRDSPGQSDEDNENDDEDNNEEDMLGGEDDDGGCTKLVTDSIQKFRERYEKIEESKRKQMVELETMRRDFQRELEFQKRQIVELAQAEIAKIREMDDDDEDGNTDTSV
ncbi:hypothetical protein OROGR_018428 [Orobanche gracilis]